MTAEDPSKGVGRTKMLVLLAGFVTAVGLGLFLITGGVSRLTSPGPTPTASPSPLPRFPACGVNEIKLTGAFNDSAPLKLSVAPFPCSRLGPTLDAVVELHGAAHDFLLYMEVDGDYSGPRAYGMDPWPDPYFHTNDGAAKVAVREVISGAFWQSTSGTLNIIGKEGRSGAVNADLMFVGGDPTPPVVRLHITGQWNCG